MVSILVAGNSINLVRPFVVIDEEVVRDSTLGDSVFDVVVHVEFLDLE